MSYSLNHAIEEWLIETIERWEAEGKVEQAAKLRKLAGESLEDAYWYLKGEGDAV